MFRRVNQVVFVLLLLLGVAAALPTTGVYSSATCEWERRGPPPTTPTSTPTLSLALRAGDVAIANALRQRVEAGLKAGGTTNIVNNPMTFPRASVTVTSIDGRWTPFWARLKLEVSVVVDRKKGGKGHEVDAVVVVDGACTGLVNGDEWQASALDALAADVLAQLAASPSPASTTP